MKVTNNSRDFTYDFPVAGGKVKDGVPETVSIAPGETCSLDVHESAKTKLQALIAFGNLSASEKDSEKAAAALASDDDGTSVVYPDAPKRRK